MGENIFINQAFTDAINLYLSNKQTPENPVFSSFPVVVIRSLIVIYGELDIINPYRTNNEDRMGGFNANLTKFGFAKADLQKFKEEFQKYMIERQKSQNVDQHIIELEKKLIDMFCARRKALSMNEQEIENFQKLLCIPSNPNALIKQELINNPNNMKKIEQYYHNKTFEILHNFQLLPYKQNTLIPEAYTALGYTLDAIAQMDEQTLEKLNNQIYNFYKIDPNDPEKSKRLKEAVTYYKQYGNSLTSGNGYVDMLLLLSIIATVMMTLFAITVKVLGG